MPQGMNDSHSNAYALMRRERDSALRNCEYWKTQCEQKMDKHHNDGFNTGVICTLAIVFVVGLFLWLVLG